MGAKQDRILNMTVLVVAQTEVTIPVSCVEQGRWGYRARDSAPSDFSLYAGLRAKKSAWVSRSLREGRGHAADQQGVWEALAQKADAHDVHSPTRAICPTSSPATSRRFPAYAAEVNPAEYV